MDLLFVLQCLLLLPSNSAGSSIHELQVKSTNAQLDINYICALTFISACIS
jgi:hypothetical protein